MPPHTTCQYSVRVEASDLVVASVSGDVRGEDVEAIYDVTVPLVSELPYFVEIIDIRGLGKVSPEARKTADRVANRIPNRRGVALVGGSLITRIILGFINRTFAIINRQVSRDPVRFFDTEAEARAWLAERRAVLRNEFEHDSEKERHDA